MTKHRVIVSAAAATAALLALGPSAAHAQSGISDVIMAGRAHGVEVPAAARARMQALGPDAFEFERAWKAPVARVRANRIAFDAALRQRPQRGAAVTVSTNELQAAGAALDGTFRMPILLGLPDGDSEPHAASAYAERMFGAGTTGYSLTSFYDEMSQGLFEFTGDVIGWAALPDAATAYYPANSSDVFGETYLFMAHTVAAADDAVDFGEYDNDGPDGVPNSGDDDGFVDVTAFMFPAAGAECGGPGIWAHRFRTNGWTGTYISTDDGSANGGDILIGDYIIQAGLDCNGSSLQQIGVVAHEAGHAFDIPDLYDTDACPDSPCADGSVGQGIGEWGLMGSGNWNEPESPAHMQAHSKARLGWIDVVTIVRDTALTIEPIVESGTAYRVDIDGAPGEYFLLENRQRLGSDANANGTGLLIWHVDSIQYADFENSNSVNNIAAHKGLDLEEADGLNELDGNSRGDAGDSWPGSAGRTAFDATTNPNSTSYAAGGAIIRITDIVETAGDDVTLSITFPERVVYGDVDDDDAVTTSDLDVVMAFVIGAAGPDYSRIQLADVDEDGDVDARDAYVIHAFVNGVPTTEFRVGQFGTQ